MRLPTPLEALALQLPTTVQIGDCDINVRKITYETERGQIRTLGYKSLCRTHWAESPICATKGIAIQDASDHATREETIEKLKAG